jgi:hypothetical protein
MVYGDFLHSDDPRLHYNRKILGILSFQWVATCALAVLCAKFGLFNNLSSNTLVFAASAFALIGSTTMFIIDSSNRHELPKSHMLLACFILGGAFLTVCLTQDLSDQFVLLTLLAVATSCVSLFLGSLFAKNKDEAQWYM